MIAKLSLANLVFSLPCWLKNCNNGQESENEETQLSEREMISYKFNLLRPSNKSCLIRFWSIAQLRNISWLKWAELVVLKPLILGITSLITRYLVTIPLTIKKVRLGATGGNFGLFWKWPFVKNLLFLTFNLMWGNY